MDRNELLKEVNRLVSSGLRRSAIALIDEYLETKPNDPFVLRALGRIYLLEKKPDQAIKYLKLSLNSNKSKTSLNTSSADYVFDGLDCDDLNYIEESSAEDDLDYLYVCEEEFEHGTKPIISSCEETQFLNITLLETDVEGDKDELNTDTRIEANLSEDYEQDFEQGDVAPGESFDNNIDLPIFSEIDVDNDSFDDVIESTEFEDEIEDYDSEETFVDEEVKSIEDEFDWDGLEDFDEIDEPGFANPYFDDQVATEGKVTRIERAKQIATEVIHAYDWGIKNLPLLQQVFYENGWAAARIAIEYELSRGLTPSELELAIFVRRLWTDNEQYWISFIHVTSNQPSQQTRAAYKNMSWREALRIVRVFNNLPTEEEIQIFVDDIYDDWYYRPKLQKQHKAFIRYLKYRTGSVKHTLPANETFSFVKSYEDEMLIDSPRDSIKYAQDIVSLKQQGIDIESFLVGYEQKYGVLKPPYKIPDIIFEAENAKPTKKSNKKRANDIEDLENLDDPSQDFTESL